MKAIIFISLILVAVASAGMAAETHMTIQTNTTIRIDPATGHVKGDAQTQISGIKIEPDPATTPTAGTSSASTATSTTPTTGAPSADSDPATTAATGVPSTNTGTSTTPTTGASSGNTGPVSTTAPETPSSTPCATCPLAQVPSGQSN
jgi:hypothetical protein